MASKPRRNRPRSPASAPRHHSPTSTQTTLVAVELGGEWPDGLSDALGGGVRRVLCQEEGEDCLGFALRVAHSVAESEHAPSALLLCNQRADAHQMLARRTLLTGLLQRHAPRLRLSAAFDARAELRAELGRLASELGSAELFFGSLTQPAPSKPQNLASVA